MSLIDKLNLTAATRANINSPEVRIRHKMVNAIDTQIAMAEAEAKGEVFVRRGLRWVKDAETGERVRKELPLRTSRWWFKDGSGNVCIQLRYGNKPLELKKGKPTIQVGKPEDLVPTLKQVREAANAGELDAVLQSAAKDRVVGRGKK